MLTLSTIQSLINAISIKEIGEANRKNINQLIVGRKSWSFMGHEFTIVDDYVTLFYFSDRKKDGNPTSIKGTVE